jgi:hypothetical protein
MNYSQLVCDEKVEKDLKNGVMENDDWQIRQLDVKWSSDKQMAVKNETTRTTKQQFNAKTWKQKKCKGQ